MKAFLECQNACALLALSSAIVGRLALAQTSTVVVELEPDAPRVLAVEGYGAAAAEVRAPPRSLVAVRIESSGVPTRVELIGEGSHVLLERDGLPRDTSVLAWATQAAATYTLTFSSTGASASRLTIELVTLRPYRKEDDLLLDVGARIAKARVLEDEGSQSSLLEALDIYRRTVDDLKPCDPTGQRSAARRLAARIETALGRLDTAARILSRSLDEARTCKEPRAEVLALTRLAEVQTLGGRYAQAEAMLQDGARIIEADGDPFLQGEIHTAFGELYSYQGQIDRAGRYYGTARVFYASCDDSVGLARLLLNETYDRVDAGEPSKAVQSGTSALRIFRDVQDRRSTARTLRILGVAHQNLGNSQESLDDFLEARDILEPLGDAKELTALFNSLSELYFEAGSFGAAREYAALGLERAQQANIPWFQAISHRLLGRALQGLEDNEAATAHLRSALAINEELNQTRSVAIVRRDLAAALKDLGRIDEAAELLESSLALARDEGNRYQEARFLNDLGEVLLLRGSPTQALSDFQSSLALHEAVGSAIDEVPVRLNIARALSSLDRLDEAVRECALALERAEQLRTGFASYDLRSSYLSSMHALYDFYIDLLMRLHAGAPERGYDERALQASELLRARTLTDILMASRAGVETGPDPNGRRRERELAEEIDRLARRIANGAGATDAEAAEMAGRYTRLKADLDQIRASIRATDPGFAGLSDPPAMDRRALRASLLDEDTALVEYHLGTDRSYVWVLTLTDFSSYVLPGAAALESASRQLYELVTSPLPQKEELFDAYRQRVSEAETELPTAADSLSGILLQPFLDRIEGKRIVLVTDGALHYVPFGMLPVSTPDGGKATLLQEHDLVRLPSAASLVWMRSDTSKGRSARTLVVADPVFSRVDPRVQREAAFAADEKLGTDLGEKNGNETLVQRGSVDLTQVARLVGSAEEASDIIRILGTSNVDFLQGFDASRERLFAKLGAYRTVHFATHSFVDDSHPELSAILLSTVAPNGEPIDGLLLLADIYDMRLPADLVVLSSCETALGREIKGEGMVGLVRGFLYAGARRIVASLWKVDDRATRELMSRFYDAMITEGMTPAAALREAKMAMSRSRNFASPYFWSGFELHGEWR